MPCASQTARGPRFQAIGVFQGGGGVRLFSWEAVPVGPSVG